jgi:hypothetical protein
MTSPRPDRVRISGPLLSFAGGFGMRLVEQGYTPCSVQFQLQLLAHLRRPRCGREKSHELLDAVHRFARTR